jgi:hypothetical protein
MWTPQWCGRCVGVVAPACAVALVVAAGSAHASDPYADAVIDYEPGIDPSPGYDVQSAILGSPERFSGEGILESVVSCFSPPWLPDELLSVGAGGWVTVEFNEPVVDDPANPWGIDLLVFGNTFLTDDAWPNGVVGGVFSAGGGVVEVSNDGRRWVVVKSASADGLFPSIGWLDAGPYDTVPGVEPTDFTRPVDPTITIDDLVGLTYDEVLTAYAGSGGGSGIDLAGTGLRECRFVRVSLPPDAPEAIQIDGFADVSPEGPERTDADLNDDGTVDGADLGLLLSAWDAAGPGDLNGDGVVDGADLGLLLAAWS